MPEGAQAVRERFRVPGPWFKVHASRVWSQRGVTDMTPLVAQSDNREHVQRSPNELKLKVYAITRTPPASRDLEFCDRLRRAARSAASNIAEGFARFRPAEFARFPVIARASLVEVQVHLNDGIALGYFEVTRRDELDHLASRAIGAVTKLVLYLRSCPPNR